VNAWLDEVRTALETETGVQLDLTNDEIEELLELARAASHESGAKLNAPLTCYLLGRAQAATGRTLPELSEIALAAGRARGHAA
jgi:hypothetical protein